MSYDSEVRDALLSLKHVMAHDELCLCEIPYQLDPDLLSVGCTAADGVLISELRSGKGPYPDIEPEDPTYDLRTFARQAQRSQQRYSEGIVQTVGLFRLSTRQIDDKEWEE